VTQNPELVCRDDRRRELARHRGINGIDYIDVADDQRSLIVYFLLKGPPDVQRANVRIEGGRRIRHIAVTGVRMCRTDDPDVDDCMVVELDRFGDFSTYRLCLVEPDEDRPGPAPMAGLDPRYACADFSFKVDCPSTGDCVVTEDCPPPAFDEPEISYLAKDYAGFRQVMLDRLALVMPEWQERHVPDVGIALVEMLAYVGDYLSYYQDAVATEAYLETARLRTSVRRHARLVDYHMHEGCNARVWVCIETRTDVTLPSDVSFATGGTDTSDDRVVTWDELDANAPQLEFFQPVVSCEREIWSSHNAISFYTWRDFECCLPAGATQASLADPKRSLRLRAGDVLIFEEVLGPRTGDPADADPNHRHAVMLTHVERSKDPVTDETILEVTWSRDDALPFALCISTVSDPPDCAELTDVSVARGNVILVDHGRPIRDETLGTVGVSSVAEPCEWDTCGPGMAYEPERFSPHLTEQPLTFAVPLPEARSAVRIASPPDPRLAVPTIGVVSLPLAPGGGATLFVPGDLGDARSLVARLRDPGDAAAQALRGRLSAHTLELLKHDGGDPSTALLSALMADLRALRQPWKPQPDLLFSGSGDYDFVVEVDNDGVAHLRFGDGDLGVLPAANATFMADYRVGNGPAGNVGAETITRIVFGSSVIRGAGLRPRNPMPAWGGTPPEPILDVKLRAPTAFRQELVRAITPDDHARLAERHPGVQRAAAVLRWTGSWPEVRVAIDAEGGYAGSRLLHGVRLLLEPYRRIGYDIVVVAATRVPLRVALHVCVLPHALRAHVEADLRRALGSRRLPGGALGFFHPDALTFGADIYLSAVVARAQATAGVDSVTVTALERLSGPIGTELAEGRLRLGALEVAELADDPNFPEHGRLDLTLDGGR